MKTRHLGFLWMHILIPCRLIPETTEEMDIKISGLVTFMNRFQEAEMVKITDCQCLSMSHFTHGPSFQPIAST